jgi:hypothetical protein
VLENIINEGSTYSQRGDANAAHKMITSFQFIFILHLMKEIMGITDGFCQHFIYNINEVYNENKNLFYYYVLLFEFCQQKGLSRRKDKRRIRRPKSQVRSSFIHNLRSQYNLI